MLVPTYVEEWIIKTGTVVNPATVRQDKSRATKEVVIGVLAKKKIVV